jgi:integrase
MPVGQATKPRRSAGEGAIYDTADGRLRGSLIVEFPDGRTKRFYVSGRTRAEVVRKLDAKRKEGRTARNSLRVPHSYRWDEPA